MSIEIQTYNKCTALVEDDDNGGDSACDRAVSIWQLSVPPSQFCCEPKTAKKKIQVFKK